MLVSAVTLSSNPESKCLACSDRSAYKEMTKRTIKEEILRRLGFSSAPNVTGEYYSKIPFIQKQIREVKHLYSRYCIFVFSSLLTEFTSDLSLDFSLKILLTIASELWTFVHLKT